MLPPVTTHEFGVRRDEPRFAHEAGHTAADGPVGVPDLGVACGADCEVLDDFLLKMMPFSCREEIAESSLLESVTASTMIARGHGDGKSAWTA
jgi:hypothetical protein